MRKGKTFKQQEKYYEVDDFIKYLVSVAYNGNFESYEKLFKELNKKCRKDFLRHILMYREDTFEAELVDRTINYI
jgi:hypothetical protein